MEINADDLIQCEVLQLTILDKLVPGYGFYDGYSLRSYQYIREEFAIILEQVLTE